jgi:hypothetical protein
MQHFVEQDVIDNKYLFIAKELEEVQPHLYNLSNHFIKSYNTHT